VSEGIGRLGRSELTVLLAMTIALTALGIDLMLPMFPAIRADLGLPEGSPAVAGLVTAYFLGLAAGQLLYGPLADRYGRKAALNLGFAIYGVGALAAVLAPNLTLLLVARAIWGFGAAGGRVVTLAVVRDIYEGERMARAMSTIMAVFILVPVVAPTFGAAIGGLVGWRWLFALCLLAVLAVALWARRLPETLADEYRMELRADRLVRAAKVVVTDRTTVGYSVAMIALFGAFTSWLGSAELIIGETFVATSSFPLIFGGLAAAMGMAAFTNGRVVERTGLRPLAHRVLGIYLVATLVLLSVSVATGGRPPLWAFLLTLAPVLCTHALLIPNCNTIAMQPMAPIAGTASAVIGASQIAGGALLGAFIDQLFDGSVLPLASGFLVLGLVAAGAITWAERGRLSTRAVPSTA
jgi:DHA1 family bicyclomycin/chloramphenicol resistance-like MFS transporter